MVGSTKEVKLNVNEQDQETISDWNLHWFFISTLLSKSLCPFFCSISSHEFDFEQIPDLTKDIYFQHIHCVGSLCRLDFRELLNPLLTS